MTSYERTTEPETFAHAGVMLALTEIQKARLEFPDMPFARAASARRAALGSSSSFDFENAMLLLERYPELLESAPRLDDVCRTTLRLIVAEMRPSWASLIPKGSEVLRQSMKFSSRNVLQCFEYAALFQDSDVAFAWWDEVEAIVRAGENEQKAINGRTGESLSMQHETERLAAAGRPDLLPVWMARRNAYAGYDIESFDVVGATARRIYIEVKACTRPPLSFHLTPNEVKVARSKSETYLIHVWDLSARRVEKIRTNQIEEHIPLNIGDGVWQDVEIHWTRSGRED